MNLADITPVILAYNEEANIGRCLDVLRWASQIVVVDSFSQDRTLEICARYPQVTVWQRVFDSAARQGNFGLSKVKTDWVLSLDSDYILSPELVSELREREFEDSIHSLEAKFVYCVYGRTLRASLYPPRKVLYRRNGAEYFDDGHTQRVKVSGESEKLRAPIYHDDCKPIERWFRSQARYAELEAAKLIEAPVRRWTDRLRRARYFAPFLNFLWCLIVKGLIFEGPRGWFYASQRLLAELMLSISLLDYDLRRNKTAGKEKSETRGYAASTDARD